MTLREGGLDWNEQQRLIRDSITSKVSLERTLAKRGLTYDDLRYKSGTDERAAWLKTRGFYPRPRCGNGVKLVSFFSGCGGMDLGFEAAGYESVACIDNNTLFCNTLRLNRPKWNVIGPPTAKGDVTGHSTLRKELSKTIDANFSGIFIGGPPCQPFSIASNQRYTKGGPNFKRIGFEHDAYGNLLFDYLWFVRRFHPRAFVVENVTGLRDVDGGQQTRLALSQMSKEGYECSVKILNAADYGVPQSRTRLFIVGSLDKPFIFPSPSSQRTACMQALGQPLDGAKNHVTRAHEAETIARYQMLDLGQREDLGRVDRLDPALPAKTVIAGGMKGGGRSHLHPLIPRTLSVRECARLQTFPDNFEFQGAIGRQFTQVGNAVPPLLAYRLGLAIAAQLFT
jgi:DNA (cytosine-5)-methyltransferase 1